MKFKKLKIKDVILVVVCIVAILLVIQNFNLKNEVVEVNYKFEKVLDDFNLFLIEKVEKCESVMLMVGNKTAIINEVHC